MQDVKRRCHLEQVKGKLYSFEDINFFIHRSLNADQDDFIATELTTGFALNSFEGTQIKTYDEAAQLTIDKLRLLTAKFVWENIYGIRKKLHDIGIKEVNPQVTSENRTSAKDDFKT